MQYMSKLKITEVIRECKNSREHLQGKRN
jgi:hypothetical protein